MSADNASDRPISPRIVYHRRYNIGFYGLERLHPFDGRKYGRAWNLLRERFGDSLSRLPVFLDSVTRGGKVKFAIYNAGTDIYVGDKLGRQAVSADGILERDRFVLHELCGRGIPTVVLLSGGYSKESYRFVADMASFVLETWGGAQGFRM